jgi:Skp family chaperone for outer membrane proteins
MRDNGSDVMERSVNESLAKARNLHLFRDFTWSKRARSSFHECNIHTLEQLTRVDPTKLLKCSNVGRATLKEIHQKLSARGLGLNFTRRQLASMRVWTPEKRVEQSEAIKAAHAKTREWKDRLALDEARREQELLEMRQRHEETARQKEKEDREANMGQKFVDAMDMAIAHGAISAARGMLDCCSPVMAKTIIDVVSAIESEDK